MLVYFTIILVTLLGFCGMAIDVGRIELRTIQLQAAADDGALTAAAERQRQNSSYIAATSTEVSSFLSQANLPAATTAVQSFASTGPYTADLSTLQVTVTQQIPLFFMGLVTGNRTRTLTAKAVAMTPPCVFLNSYTGAPSNFYTVYLQSSSLKANCPVYANSGVNVDGFSTLGNYQAKITGPSTRSGEVSGHFNASPLIYNSPVLTDPLAYITAPAFSACTYTGMTYTTSKTISPGTYCGGITINGASVIMNPGLYIITGGMQMNSATLSGSGVTMYFTQGGGSGYGTFKLQTSSVMHVNAPTDATGGGIPGVVIFGDRNWSGGVRDFIFSDSTYQGDGIIYTTNTGINVSGGGLSGYNYLGIDAGSIYQYASTVSPSCNYSSLPGGNPFHIPVSLVQ